MEECREQCSQQAEQLVSVQLALAQHRQQSEQQLLSEQQRADALLADERAMCERRLDEATTRFEEQRLALEVESRRQEEERRMQDESRRRQEAQAQEAAKADWQRRERDLTDQLLQLRQERDKVRLHQETSSRKDEETIQSLSQQLVSADCYHCCPVMVHVPSLCDVHCVLVMVCVQSLCMVLLSSFPP